MRKVFVLVGAIAISAAACGGLQPASTGVGGASTNTPSATVTFPGGDVKAGRQAFLDLKCTACHAVPSEPEFPAPVTANPAPPIDARLAGHDVSYLVSTIMSPSHELSHSGDDAELRARLKGVLPPMGGGA